MPLPETGPKPARGEAISLADNEFQLLRRYIEESCGICLGGEKAYLVESRLVGLLGQTGSRSYRELHLKAAGDPSHELRDRIVDAMTTRETLWFRDVYPFTILSATVFARFFEEIRTGKRKRIRVWCTACSTGQKPYSIASRCWGVLISYSAAMSQSIFPASSNAMCLPVWPGLSAPAESCSSAAPRF